MFVALLVLNSWMVSSVFKSRVLSCLERVRFGLLIIVSPRSWLKHLAEPYLLKHFLLLEVNIHFPSSFLPAQTYISIPLFAQTYISIKPDFLLQSLYWCSKDLKVWVSWQNLHWQLSIETNHNHRVCWWFKTVCIERVLIAFFRLTT